MLASHHDIVLPRYLNYTTFSFLVFNLPFLFYVEEFYESSLGPFKDQTAEMFFFSEKRHWLVKMLENRPEDALVLLVETVEIV